MVAELTDTLSVRDYPLATVYRARSLYISQGLPAGIIAKSLELSVDTIYFWAKHYGWAKAREESVSQQLGAENLASAVRVKLEEAAIRSADMLSKAMDVTGEALTEGDARTAMFASSTAKNLMDLATKGSGMDRAATAAIAVTFSLDSLYQPGSQVLNVTPEKPALPAP
jgi:hypothetical protein